MVCTGVIAWFAFQTFENIGMTLGLMPMTGVPLPFLSYGGSSLVANWVIIAILLVISNRARRPAAAPTAPDTVATQVVRR
jgi:rod shape determining protein RodA